MASREELPGRERDAARGVMWLLNHGTLRTFEVDQLRRAGMYRIYTPKRFPYDEGNLSATVDASLDAGLDLPAEDLAALNRQNWYECDDPAAWEIANRHFGIAFIGFFPRQIETVLRHFRGVIVIRVFGLAQGATYSALMREHLSLATRTRLREEGGRVWFGSAYEHLAECEEEFFDDRQCHLPVGLAGEDTSADWRGEDARLFFVCPRIGSSPYYGEIHARFKKSLGDLPHVIGGAQPIAVSDSNALGYVTREVHARNMRELRAMYYHSREPRHVHYHPFEAIRAGMPLVFMAGGLLDRLGGRDMPGRCRTDEQAHRKIARLLAGDRTLIEDIRLTQRKLLEPMLPERCGPIWQQSFARILDDMRSIESRRRIVAPSRPRIAVIVPVGYRGGTLRAAKLLAQAITIGSRAAGEPADVVLGHLDDAATYPEREFHDLPEEIKRRPFRWKTMDRDEAARSLAYAGVDADVVHPTYASPDDGVAQFGDCDLWLFVSDRLHLPLLPIKPYALMVYDYLQRYENFLDPAANACFLRAQREADRVFVTTEFTYRDARDYAALPLRHVRKLPMLVPQFSSEAASPRDLADAGRPYFLWTTNLSAHKNHENAALALSMYFDELDGALDCRVSGVDTDKIPHSDLPHLAKLRSLRSSSPALRRKLRFLGELPDRSYRALLAGAMFLWHPGRIDNGTFSVVEAACLGVPALSSDYPAMHEIARANHLAPAWMDPNDPEAMAHALKRMETEAQALRGRIPVADVLRANHVEQHAAAYWREIRECL
jgi:glycosyltransferase involved in cell wall biosynthesis